MAHPSNAIDDNLTRLIVAMRAEAETIPPSETLRRAGAARAIDDVRYHAWVFWNVIANLTPVPREH